MNTPRTLEQRASHLADALERQSARLNIGEWATVCKGAAECIRQLLAAIAARGEAVAAVHHDEIHGWGLRLLDEAEISKLPHDTKLYAGQPPAPQMEIANATLLDAMKDIYQYGADTLSGRTDGPDDRKWQRDAVLKMTLRAKAALEVPNV